MNLSGCISLPEQIFQDLDATLRDLEELDGTRDVLVVGSLTFGQGQGTLVTL